MFSLYTRLISTVFVIFLVNKVFFTELIKTPKRNRLHICMRTKNSEKYIEELLDHYFYEGTTSISIYDDSDTDSVAQIVENSKYNIDYYKSNINKNENEDLIKCFNDYYLINDFIMNVDDDEFFYPTHTDNCKKTLLSILQNYVTRAPTTRCLALPVYFFGTSGVKSSNMHTISQFTKRDEDVDLAQYRRLRSKNLLNGKETLPRAFYMYSTDTSYSIRTRIQKAIFIVDKKDSYLEDIIKRYRRGSLIHGYGMNCDVRVRPPISVAHYTRSKDILNDRTKLFWKKVYGLRRRFNSEERIEKYLQERDRNIQEDLNVLDAYKCSNKKVIQVH